MLTSADFNKEFASLLISTHEVGLLGLKFGHNINAKAMSDLLFEATNPQFSWFAKTGSQVNFALEQESEQSFKLEILTALNLWTNCVRCLSPIEHLLKIDLSMRMLKNDLQSQDQENELCLIGDLSQDDDLIGYFALDSIDLGLILREQIFLSVPDYPHCGGDYTLVKSSCVQESLSSTETHRKPFAELFSKLKF